MANVVGNAFSGGSANVVGGPLTTGADNTYKTTILVKDYGAVGNGITDDSIAIRNAHTFANSNGYTVSYEGLTKVAVQANAQIPINTNIDFANCKFLLLNSVAGTPSYNGNVLFTVSDPIKAVVLEEFISPTSPSTNLLRGSVLPTIGIFNGPGYARISHVSVVVPGSGANGVPISTTVPYSQSFYVHRGGEVSHALANDLTATGGTLSLVSVREASDRRVVISNFSIYLNGFNSQRLFYVTRNNVDFRNIFVGGYVDPYAGGSYSNINQLIHLEYCGDITITDYKLAPQMTTGTSGTYGLACYHAADIFVQRMTSIGKTTDGGSAWGTIYTEDVNGFHITDSIVNNVGAESGAFNFFVHDCAIHGDSTDAAVQFGWGGGTLSVKNTKIYNAHSIVYKLPNYSGTWFGDMEVANCEISSSHTTLYGIRIDNVGAPIDTYCPDIITVQNIARVGRTTTNDGGVFTALQLTVRDTPTYVSAKVYAPFNINVRNVACVTQWRGGVNLDLLNIVRSNTNHNLDIQIDGIRCDLTSNAANVGGFYDYAKHAGRTIASTDYPSRMMISIKNCSRFQVQTRMYNATNSTRHMYLDDCDLTGLDLSGTSDALYCRVNSCRFLNNTSYGATVVLGGIASASNKYTVFNNCRLSSATTWDLSRASILQGIVIQGSAVLPTGATKQSAFLGWYDSTMTNNGYRVINSFDNVLADYVLQWPATTAELPHQRLGIGTTGGQLTWNQCPIVRYCSGAALTQYSSTNEEILSSVLIPANSIGPKGAVRIFLWVSNANTSTSTKTIRIRLSTTPYFSPNGSANYSGTQVFTNAMNTSTQFSMYGYALWGNNASDIKWDTTNALGNHTGTTTTSGVPFDTTQDFYVNITAQTFSTSALFILNGISVETIYA